jgi:hypothetical protein
MRELMLPLLAQMYDNAPALFADLYARFQVVISSMQNRKE